MADAGQTDRVADGATTAGQMISDTESPDAAPQETPIFQRMDTCARFPYSFSEYARRAMWILVYNFFVRFSPARLSAWRRFWLCLFGARIARTAIIRPKVRVRHPWLLRVGEYSTLGDNTEVYNLGPIEIGSHTVISQNTHLCNGTHDYRDPSLPLIRPTMRIGSGVWVCADAFIGPGVTIGDNALVGARAVVMRDIPPGVIAAGNPARVIRDRPMEAAGGG